MSCGAMLLVSWVGLCTLVGAVTLGVLISKLLWKLTH